MPRIPSSLMVHGHRKRRQIRNMANTLVRSYYASALGSQKNIADFEMPKHRDQDAIQRRS